MALTFTGFLYLIEKMNNDQDELPKTELFTTGTNHSSVLIEELPKHSVQKRYEGTMVEQIDERLKFLMECHSESLQRAQTEIQNERYTQQMLMNILKFEVYCSN